MQSTPQGRFPDFFGPWSFEPGSVTDLWGLLLGVAVFLFTALVAWRQLKIMNKQSEMMARAESIATRQEALAQKQGDIAETQFKIEQDLHSRRSRPVISLEAVGITNAADSTAHAIWLHNVGNRTLHGCKYVIYANKDQRDSVVLQLAGAASHEVARPLSADNVNDKYIQIAGRLSLPIWPQANHKIGQALIVEPLKVSQVDLLWRIHCEDGVFPEQRPYASIELTFTEEDLPE